jgi:hypothetical protein
VICWLISYDFYHTSHVTRHKSYFTRHTPHVTRHLQYLAEEAAALGLQFNSSEWGSEVVKVPQQRNWYDPYAPPSPYASALCAPLKMSSRVTRRCGSFDCGVFTCAFLLHASMRQGTDMPFTQVGNSSCC